MDAQLRSKGIGGSDVAAILGMSPYRTPWDVYASKTGLLDAVIQETNSRMKWGKRLERLIAEGWSELTKKEHAWDDQTKTGRFEWQVYTPDAWSAMPGDRRGIECKTAGLDRIRDWGESGTDDIPAHYIVQCQWYMSAADVPAWDVAVLIAGNDFRVYTLTRDSEIEATLLEEAEKFWRDNVMARVAPPIGASGNAEAYLKSRFPKNIGNIRQATAEELALILEYLPAREAFDAAEERKKALENRIKEAIGETEGLSFEGGKITWKKVKDGLTTDWEAIAKAAGADQALIDKWTVTKPGYRRLYVGVK